MTSLRRFLFVALPILLLATPAVMAQPAKCPDPPALCWQPPHDVGLTIDPGFDDFSWRSFVALVWPSASGRGAPDQSARPGAANRIPVFLTYKADWEVFQPDGSEPSAWSSYDVKKTPCRGKTGTWSIPPGALQLAAFTKFGNVLLASRGGFAGPLISQNKQYTRILAAFNEVAFDNIRNQSWYLQSELLPDVNFERDADGNPIAIKSAWVVITEGMNAKRFYTTQAYVLDTKNDKCTPVTVGLVGLHIVTKTAKRPQWIWSTFEQIDNIPQDGAAPPYTYHDGTAQPMPERNPYFTATPVPCDPHPAKDPCPFNVTRVHPIAALTGDTNKIYRETLAKEGSGVSQYYQLIMTQRTKPENSTKDGRPDNTIPGSGTAPMTSFANVTMETFEQSEITSGCMACHNSAAVYSDQGVQNPATDFMWSLPLNAWSPSSPQLGTASVANAKLMAQPPSATAKKLLKILAQGAKAMPAPKTPAKKSAKPKTKQSSKGKDRRGVNDQFAVTAAPVRLPQNRLSRHRPSSA